MVIDLSMPQRRSNKDLLRAVIYLTLILVLTPGIAGADGRLTDIFLTKSFSGSWDTVNTFGWLGEINRWMISAISVVGLISVIGQRMTSMLYLSGRSTWDAVWEAKEEDKGHSFFGMTNSFKQFFGGNRGVGIDAILQLFYVMLPNVKYYSDFNPNRSVHNVKPEDSMITYMLKVFMPTVMVVFFFSAGFDGSLVRGYGMVANGMSAVADKIVDTNVEGFIKQKLNTGEAYDFTLGSSNTKAGKFGQDIAKDVYSKVLSRTKITDSTDRLAIGEIIEGKVFAEILGSKPDEAGQRKAIADKLPKPVANGGAVASNSLESDSDMDALNYDLVVNTSKTGGTGTLNWAIKDLLPKGTVSSTLGDSLYAHIIIKKSKVSESDFFVVPQK